ncbi:hypothetical protein [Streptomyces sp. NBC_01285]|uniref:hypothetical protein n=1 Tax=Streptomyces sp. NBC_01285 TaxID=2903813 RepID=UPI00225A351B|nr:hypothetical protein [Streptomyces sp. NBC_01285]MCX4773712.1 hypothetical protein [Streptomyces sp. NBC_01285]
MGELANDRGDMAHLGAEPGQVVAGFDGAGVIGGQDQFLGRQHGRQLGRRRVVGSLGIVPACLASTGPEDLWVLAELGPRVRRHDEEVALRLGTEAPVPGAASRAESHGGGCRRR